MRERDLEELCDGEDDVAGLDPPAHGLDDLQGLAAVSFGSEEGEDAMKHLGNDGVGISIRARNGWGGQGWIDSSVWADGGVVPHCVGNSVEEGVE